MSNKQLIQKVSNLKKEVKKLTDSNELNADFLNQFYEKLTSANSEIARLKLKLMVSVSISALVIFVSFLMLSV